MHVGQRIAEALRNTCCCSPALRRRRLRARGFGFGVPAERVASGPELEAALAESRERPGPFLIDAIVDEWETPVLGRPDPWAVAANN